MNREEYIKQLEYLLQDVPDSEREEALAYYQDYFEDAGESEEANVIATLGSPEKVAAMIKDGLNGSDDEAGEYTESGYQDDRFRENNKVPEPRGGYQKEEQDTQSKESGYQKNGGYESSSYQKSGDYQNSSNYQNSSSYQNGAGYNGQGFDRQSYGGNAQGYGYKDERRREQKGFGTGKIILIVLLCIFAVPVGIPILGAVFGLLMGILGVLLGVGVAVIAGTFASFVAGVVLVGVGIAKMFVAPPVGFLLCGFGLFALAVGLLLLLLAFWVVGKVVPWMLRGITSFCGRLFRRRRG